MNSPEIIKNIRRLIFQNAKEADSMELLHWYVALDECFENDEFHTSEMTNMYWRLSVLRDEGESINEISRSIKLLTEGGNL